MTRKKDPFLEFSQSQLFEGFLDQPTFQYKRMFGGLACYFNGLLVAVLMEEPKSDWNGFLVPTDFVHHESLKSEIPGLINHPVLGKWLYAAMTDDSYESSCDFVLRLIRKGDPRVGIIPGLKKKKKAKTRKKSLRD
jgi:hypothetical protein